jgi:hypothetical protein
MLLHVTYFCYFLLSRPSFAHGFADALGPRPNFFINNQPPVSCGRTPDGTRLSAWKSDPRNQQVEEVLADAEK